MTEFVEQIYASDAELPDDVKSQALCFLRMYYPEGFQGANGQRDWLHHASDQPIHIAITTPNRILAGYCAVVRRPLHHSGETYNCWGLTGVLTYPAFRRRGLGSRWLISEQASSRTARRTLACFTVTTRSGIFTNNAAGWRWKMRLRW